MPDPSYTPDLLAQLRAQLQAATATGLPWMVENAQRAYDYARAGGADLPFDAQGNDIPGGAQLPPISAQQQGAIDQTSEAIRNADPAVFQPPAPVDSQYSVDQQLLAAQNQLPPAGTGNPAVTPPAPSLAEDPAYQAFVRALGAEKATAQRTTDEGVDTANRTLALRLPQIADSGVRAREGISGGYETRGLLRSGQHETALDRQRQAEGNQSASLTDQTAQQVASLRSGLAERMAGFDSRQAEQDLAASGRLQASQDAQRLAASEQTSMAALLAAQQRSNDALGARYDAAIRNQGPPPPGSVTPAPTGGAIGIVGLDPTDPDYLQKMIAQMEGR